MNFMEHYFHNKYYDMAIDRGIQIIRKRAILRKSSNESMNRICEKWDNLMEVLVERHITFAKNQWNEFRTFFVYDEINFGGIETLFIRIRFIIGDYLVDAFHSWKNFNKFCNAKKPYVLQLGYIDNDLNPALGKLTNFNYSGGIALDYNLRSIGANLGSIKPIVAIRLRNIREETRVKPENLSLWISNDNKLYCKYSGKITFSNESRAMTLDHLDIVGQFLKIHCDYKDVKYTFEENFNNFLNIYGPPLFQ